MPTDSEIPDRAALKRKLRAELQERRAALPAAARAAAAAAVATAAERIALRPGMAVSAYWPIRSELDPRPLASALRRRGAILLLPALLGRTGMVFREWAEDGQLVEAGFGIREPSADAPVRDPDVLLVPLTGFTCAGDRLGYGAGYYDRALARLAPLGATAIGIAFAAQEVAALPAEPHDRRLDAVLTEAGWIDCVGARQGAPA